MNGDVLHSCYPSCDLFDGGSVQDYLTDVENFLDANPNEVLKALRSRRDIRPPSLAPRKTERPADTQHYDHSVKRVVIFPDAEPGGADTVDLVLPEFQMIWEAPFSVIDASFPCSIDRINGSWRTACI
ncbi:hypothetical protein B0H13DRAFT_2318726 [Mycena leptocephala]|nr:hypothetical protein B0H13DRAFT_2318726 [Mycena leptocephala]